MKLTICLTVALTALSVAAAPSLGSPVYLQERGSFGAAAGLLKAASKIPHHVRAPKLPHGIPAPRKPSRNPPRPPPHVHKPSRGPVRTPQVRPQVRPAQSRPAPKPQSRPAPSNSDAFSGLDGMFNDAASQNEPHFNVGSLLRRNRDYYM